MFNFVPTLQAIRPMAIWGRIILLDSREFWFSSDIGISAWEVFGHIYRVGQDPSDSKSNWLHVDIIFRFCFDSFEVYSCIDSSRMMGNSPEVLTFNRLFLKLNRFICNLTAGSPRAVIGRWISMRALHCYHCKDNRVAHSLFPWKLSNHHSQRLCSMLIVK